MQAWEEVVAIVKANVEREVDAICDSRSLTAEQRVAARVLVANTLEAEIPRIRELVAERDAQDLIGVHQRCSRGQ